MKYLKYIVPIIIALLIIVLVIVIKNKSLNKLDIDNDFGLLEYKSEQVNGENSYIALNASHELEYSLNSTEGVTKRTLTDTEYNAFKSVLINSDIMKLSKKVGQGKEGTYESITLTFLNDETFETGGYNVTEPEFRVIIDCLNKIINGEDI